MVPCVCSCQRAALLRDQPPWCFKAASRLATVNRKEINWVPTGQLLRSVSVSLCCGQLVPGPRCRLSEGNRITLPGGPLPASPAVFPFSIGRLEGREVQTQGPILPDAEHPLGRLKPVLEAGSLAGDVQFVNPRPEHRGVMAVRFASAFGCVA